MSKKCKNCGAVLPDEANYCLECMTAFDNSIKEIKDAPIPNGTFKERLLSRLTGLKSRVSSMSKRQKAALVSALTMLLLLVPLSVYLFSPVDPVGGVTADTAAGNNNNGSRPITRVEALFDEVFGTESNPNDPLSENSSTSDTGSGSGNNSVSETVESGAAAGNTEAAAPGNGNSTSAGSGSSSGSDSNGNNSTGSSEPVLNYDDWEYMMEDGDLIVTKYTGNDKNVLVPDKINDINIHKLDKHTFKDNSTLETVTFKNSEDYHILWISSSTFYNCSSLKKVVFPTNTDIGIFPTFAVKCPNLTDIDVDHWQYKFENGALYYYDTKRWFLYEYCEGNTSSSYTVPDWVTAINNASDNFLNCKYLKKIYLNDKCSGPTPRSNYNLEGIYVGDANPSVADYDGVLYTKFEDFVQFSIYPAGKKDKSFTLPQDSYSYLRNAKNTYLETLTVPKTAEVPQKALEHLLESFPNLKTIKIEKDHPDLSMFQSYLNDKVNIIKY